MGKCQSFCGNECSRETSVIPVQKTINAETGPKEEVIVAFLDHYRLGSILGEGAFGVVAVCHELSSGCELAVKMVDKVETPLADIQREAELLQKMDHPNIVKCFGVFDDKCFVCIVMSKLDGGDMVGALEERSKLRSFFADYDLVHVKRQMVSALSYIHAQYVIHRDIKGDNFLMDRFALTDPHCRVVLADFGNARVLQPGDRLSESCGTRPFWSPEFYSLSYTHKVDVWALGVLCFGLVTGKYPFKGETEVRNKEVIFPSHVSSECRHFVRSMLERDESLRLTASQLVQHSWLDGTHKRPTTMIDLNPSIPSQSDTFIERVDHGIKRRRLSLLERMEEEHVQKAMSRDKAVRKVSSLLSTDGQEFSIQDRLLGIRRLYRWLPRSEMRKHQSLRRFGQAGPISAHEKFELPRLELPLFHKFLEEHNIKTVRLGVGDAKTLEALAQEVQSGASRLMLDAAEHKKLVRVVDVVLLKLFDDQERLLVDAEEHNADGRSRFFWRLPGSKKETYENVAQTTRRILEETLNLDATIVNLKLREFTLQEEEQSSPSYPGLYTVYRKEIVTGYVSSKDPVMRTRFGLDGKGFSAIERDCTRKLRWITEEEAEANHFKLNHGMGSNLMSSLVLAPIGLKEVELTEYLQKDLGVDVNQYGRSGAKTLKEFSEQLIKGEVHIVKGKNGAGYVVSEVVNLCMHNKTGEVLFQVKQEGPDGYVNHKLLVPSASRRPDESTFLVAKRIIRKSFLMDPNDVLLDTEVRLLQEERSANAYPGLVFVEREHVISARAEED